MAGVLPVDGQHGHGTVEVLHDSDLPAARPQPHGADSIETVDLLDASRALSAETSLDRLRDRVGEVFGALTGATAVRLVLRDEETGQWSLGGGPGAAGPIGEGTAGEPVPVSVIRCAERAGEPLLVDDAAHDDRFAGDPYLTGMATCALMVVPILAQGTPLAMLLLENRHTRGAFTADRLDAVRLLAGQLAVSVANALRYASLERQVADRTEALAQANERLEQLAVADALTGLPNRRRLGEFLEAEWRRALRPRYPIAVAMIDIDEFTSYNDHYGRPAGDRCLQRVAGALADILRNTDYVTRYGGAEFCLAMPETDLPGAVIAAERVRVAVEQLGEPHAASARGIVTVSVGVAAVRPTPADQVENLISQAGEQLDEAKRAGRNRTVG